MFWIHFLSANLIFFGITKSIFDDIIESDHTGHIIGEENKKLLDDMLGRNGKILRKLKNKEFRIIVSNQ